MYFINNTIGNDGIWYIQFSNAFYFSKLSSPPVRLHMRDTSIPKPITFKIQQSRDQTSVLQPIHKKIYNNNRILYIYLLTLTK